jgi:hypothetical protein
VANLAKVSLLLRRLTLSFLLALVLFCLIAPFYPEAAWKLFLPCWIVLLIVSPYLDRKPTRKPSLNIPDAPSPPRPKRPTAWGRVIVTGLVACGVTFGMTLFPIADFSMIAGPLIWIALYFGSPALSRRLPLPESWKPKAQADAALSEPKPGFWRFVGRGALAMLGFVTVIILLPAMITAPIAHNFVRARKVHDSIRAGMTVPEVLSASRDCDLFGAASAPSNDDTAAGDRVSAISLIRNTDGTYRISEGIADSGTALTETQAVERVQAKLHDGYRWRSNCIYVNMTSMHVSFSVIFGPDGRVTEVTPIRGWD